MKNPLSLLRLAYRTGAVLDGLAVIPMLCPQATAALLGLENFHPGPPYRFAMGMGASLMAGWTALLLWADRKPVERRGVLLLTICPVVLGLVASEIYAVCSGLVSAPRMAPTWALQAALIGLFGYAYRQSRKSR